MKIFAIKGFSGHCQLFSRASYFAVCGEMIFGSCYFSCSTLGCHWLKSVRCDIVSPRSSTSNTSIVGNSAWRTFANIVVSFWIRCHPVCSAVWTHRSGSPVSCERCPFIKTSADQWLMTSCKQCVLLSVNCKKWQIEFVKELPFWSFCRVCGPAV